MTTFITIPHEPYNHNAPWSLSSQFSMTPVITILHGPCHHNAPLPLSSQCSMPLSSKFSMTLVVTMLHGACHHNDQALVPEFGVVSLPQLWTVSVSDLGVLSGT